MSKSVGEIDSPKKQMFTELNLLNSSVFSPITSLRLCRVSDIFDFTTYTQPKTGGARFKYVRINLYHSNVYTNHFYSTSI